MTRPLQDVHHEQRRIGKLHEENLFARNVGDSRGIVPQGKRMKAVDDQPEMRVVRAFDDVPRLGPAVDRPPPGKRFVPDAQMTLRRAFREFVQLRRRALFVSYDVRRRVGTNQH